MNKKTGKYLAKSKNGKMLKIGQSATDPEAKWYFMTEAVIKFENGKFKNGDSVVIDCYEKDDNEYISKISKEGSDEPIHAETGAYPDNGFKEKPKQKWLSKEEWIQKKNAEKGIVSTKPECPSPVVDNFKVPEKKTWGKSPEEQDTIRRQAIGHMASRALNSMAGHVNPGNVLELSEMLYKYFKKLVEE